MVIYEFDDGERYVLHSQESVDTPNFAVLKTTGQRLPINPHQVYKQTRYDPIITVNTTGSGQQKNHAGYQLDLVAANTGYIQSLVTGEKVSILRTDDVHDELSLRLTNKVRHSELNLGVTMGEFPETAEFIHSAMVRTAKGYRYLRRGQVQRALDTLTGRKNVKVRDIPGALADSWLAFVFGFQPIANDVASAAKVLQEGLLDPPGDFVFFSKKTWELNREVHDIANHVKMEGDITGSGMIRVKVTNPDLYKLEQLGLTNPAHVAWELVPFSFVVDWFVPVGQFIQSIQPPSGVTVLDGWTYVKRKVKTKNWTTLGSPGDAGWNTSMTADEHLKDRRVLSAFATPKIRVPDVSLSKGQVASGMALLYKALESFTIRKRG